MMDLPGQLDMLTGLLPATAWPTTYPVVPAGWVCPSCGYAPPPDACYDGTRSHGPAQRTWDWDPWPGVCQDRYMRDLYPHDYPTEETAR